MQVRLKRYRIKKLLEFWVIRFFFFFFCKKSPKHNHTSAKKNLKKKIQPKRAHQQTADKHGLTVTDNNEDGIIQPLTGWCFPSVASVTMCRTWLSTSTK